MTGTEKSFAQAKPGIGWTLLATTIFLVIIASFQYPTWSAGFDTHVGFPQAPDAKTQNAFIANDQLYVVGFTGRNARMLLSNPMDFYEADPCFPGTRTLAYSEPMITLSLVATPAYLLTESPAAAYNFGVLLMLLLSSLAMYWLVSEWTGIPAAGIVAGLLYGFEANRMADLVHVYVYDGAWTVFALLFARRWFAWGRWRDALGLAIATALQFGAAFYPVLAAMCISLPFAFWLAFHYGFSKLRWSQIVVVAAIVGLAGLAIYGPYVAMAGSPDMPERTVQLFALFFQYGPGEMLFPGWFCLVLATLGLFFGSSLALGARISMLAGIVMVVWLAAGSTATHYGLPDLYQALSFLPGLQSVRVPAKIATGINFGLCVLAGCGVAVLLQRLRGNLLALASCALILAGGSIVIGPYFNGGVAQANYEPRNVALTPEERDFFETLEQMGNSGPLLELPLKAPYLAQMMHNGRRSYRAVFHQRRTSACVGSYKPPEVEQLNAMSLDQFDTRLVERIAGMGFTTIVVHHPKWAPKIPAVLAQLNRASERRGSGVRLLHSNNWMTAFELVTIGDPTNVSPASKQVFD